MGIGGGPEFLGPIDRPTEHSTRFERDGIGEYPSTPEISREDLREAVLLMKGELERQGIANGVVAAMIRMEDEDPQVEIGIAGSFEREPDPVGRGPTDKGTSYGGVIWGKMFESLSTLLNSGTTDREPRKGEFGYKGALIRTFGNLKVITACSGGTEEQDVVVAGTGMEYLIVDEPVAGMDAPFTL